MPKHTLRLHEWEKVRVQVDYNVAVDGHFYSAPDHL
ncbi:hypothetical protein [Pseudomonas sp. Irchel 3E13]